jgi:hypothetical protein
MAESLDLGELEKNLIKYVNWCRKNVVKRTQEGHLRGIRNWFKKAEEFKAERGNGSGGGLDGVVSVSNGAGDADLADPLAPKLAAYRSFQAKGMGEWYLETCCTPSVRKAILAERSREIDEREAEMGRELTRGEHAALDRMAKP